MPRPAIGEEGLEACAEESIRGWGICAGMRECVCMHGICIKGECEKPSTGDQDSEEEKL